MKKSIFRVDGIGYPGLHVVSLKRSFSVLDGENAGRVMSFDMVRDVGGTFYNYSMEFDPDQSSPEEYDAFYEVISAPVDCHTIEVPYAQGTMIFRAYVTNGEDELFDAVGGVNRWDNLTCNFIAMSPQRRPS